MQELITTIDARGVATLTLNRPERRNALDAELIGALARALHEIGAMPNVRVIMLAGNGPAFCAGADLGWMRRMAGMSMAENEKDAQALAELLQTLDALSKPTVALVHGAVYGGGVGLVACCDIALATDSAHFCLSEVKLGLVPAIVGPFVMRAIGTRQARRFFLTAEDISAEDALQIGLLHVVAGEDEFPTLRERIINALLAGAPGAQAEAKALLALYARRAIDGDLLREASRALARRRASAEARIGFSAFLARRAPSWRPPE